MQTASLTGTEHWYMLLVVLEKTVGYDISRIQSHWPRGHRTESVCLSVYPTSMAIVGTSDL